MIKRNNEMLFRQLHPPLLLMLLLTLAYLKGVISVEVEKISNPSEFINFVSNVNRGSTYSGTTVFLTSDLSFSGKTLDPIGKDTDKHFRGVFDGQGHVISSLSIRASLQHVGLFGYSEGLTIKSVVLDSTCTITSSYSGTSIRVYAGGLIGLCNSSSSKSYIESIVNMANVTFDGNIGTSSDALLFLGGIIGQIYPSSDDNTPYVKNCANYGSVTSSGSSSSSYIGGIVGGFEGQNHYPSYIYNCINYGTITSGGTTQENARLGGIIGFSHYAHIENCVSAGMLSLATNVKGNAHVGSIVGYASSSTYIKYCYYTSELSEHGVHGGNTPTPNLTETPTSPTAIDSTLINNLNNYASNNGWNGWLFNANNATITTRMNDNNGFSLSSQVVLLQTPALSDFHAIGVWYTSTHHASSLQANEVTGKTTLYGLYGTTTITVTFNASGGEVTPASMPVICGKTYGSLPKPNRTGYTFAGWFNEDNESVTSGTTVEKPQNHTLHAHWTANTYIVIFDTDGGGGILTSKPIVFGSAYGELPTPNRTGYTFAGWFTETPGGDPVDETTIVTSPHGHTIYAHWNPILYTVSFDTNGGSACENISQSYGTRLTLPKSERTGYAFIGWFDAGLATEYTTKTVQAVNITLYAKWEPNTYNVSFDEDCGIYNESVSVAFDSTYDLPEPPGDDTTILWWDVEETGGRVVDGGKVKIADDITLCAVWKTNPVALNASGGDVSPATVNATYNESYGVLPIPEMAGYSFLGWFNETGGSVTNETTVTTPKSHTLYAQWTINHYTITFDFGGGKTMTTTQRYGDVIIYPNEVPSKSFHKFREWCTRDVAANSKTCDVTHVPANDLTFTPSFGTDSSLLTGVSFAIIAAVLAIVLLVVVLILVMVVRKMRRDYEPVDIELDEENEENTVNRANERVEARIFQQVGAMKISNSFAKTLKNPFKKAEKNKGLDETLADLGVERIDDESDDVIESFRTNGAVQTSIASAVHKKENLVAVAEYLRLLYATAREQEEYKEFDELYFGMKSIDNFMDKVDEKTIGFCGVVSGFTSKRKAVQFLMPRANEKEEDGIDMPSGVLFKVKKREGVQDREVG